MTRATMFAAFTLAACGGTETSHSRAPEASIDPAMTQFLVDSAASDFRAHRPNPVRVRNARVGSFAAAGGEMHYVLCGEFLPEPKPADGRWLFFATVKTDPYEQYVGPDVPAQCRHAAIRWGREVTASLQSRLDAPR